MDLQTLKKWSRLVRVLENPLDFVLEEVGRKREPWVARLRNGLRVEIRPGRGDRHAFRESWLQGDYLKGGLTIGPGDTVVDVGANIGCFAIFAAHTVGPTGHVVAVEPSRDTFAQLTKNVALSGLTNVTTVKAAVDGRSGKVELIVADNALFSSLRQQVDGRPTKGDVEVVKAITIPELLSRYVAGRVRLLKLDCEGAEHEIVASISQDTMRAIDQVSMELHQVSHVPNERVTTRLQELGYSMVRDNNLYYFRAHSAV